MKSGGIQTLLALNTVCVKTGLPSPFSKVIQLYKFGCEDIIKSKRIKIGFSLIESDMCIFKASSPPDEEPEEALSVEQIEEKAKAGDARAQTWVSESTRTHILARGIVFSPAG